MAGDPAADLLAVAVLVPPAQRLADPVVAHLVHQTGLVVEADVLAEFAVADLAVRAGSVALAGLGLLDAADHRARVGDEACRAGALGPVVHNLNGK